MKLTKFSTLEEARVWLERNKFDDTNCPCCFQKYRVYKRTIGSSTALSLIIAYRLKGTRDYVHVKDIAKEMLMRYGVNVTGGGDFAKLKSWRLIEECPVEHEDKKNSGYWRVTERGEQFVLRKIRLRKYALILTTNLLGFDGDFVSIQDCLRERFSYQELMKVVLRPRLKVLKGNKS